MSSYFLCVSAVVVYWVFSIKYWSIAVKIELAVLEKDITERNRLINWLLFGGITLLSLLCVSPTLQVVFLFTKPPAATYKCLKWLTIVLFIGFLLSACFLVDALRRLSKIKVENKTISNKMVVCFGLSVLLELIGTFSFFVGKNDNIDRNVILVCVGFFFGVSLMATILFLIGISTVEDQD